MEMLCCSPRSASSLLERAGLFPRTDEEYELRVIVWEARAVAIEPPKARLPQWTQRSAPPSSTRLRPMYCACITPTQHSLSNHDTRPMRLRLGAQAGKHVLVRVQPRGEVPGNYALQRTDEGGPSRVKHRRRRRVQLAHAVTHVVGHREGAADPGAG